MVDAAERLVAERGIGSVSLREVQAASGQRNKSAAQYHFGSRDGLLEAVVVTRMAPVNARRLALLAELDAQGTPSLRDIVAALIHPLAEATVGRPGSCYARFLAQAWTDPIASTLVERNLQGESHRAVRTRLVAQLDHLPEPLRQGRVDRVLALVVLTLAAWEAGQVRRDAPPLTARLADLVDSCVAVLEAPASPDTRAALGTLIALEA